MDFSKFRVKVKQAAEQRKTKLLAGDYQVRSKTKKVIGYATAVGRNITNDVKPTRHSASQLFPFTQPPQQQRNPKRRHYEEKRRRHHRSRRRQQKEPYNPYPLI